MTFILANWELIAFVVMAIVFVAMKVYQFVRTPSEKRQALIKEWLVEAVGIAEEEFGTKTGELKYAFVYEMFTKKYKWFGRFISKSLFSKLVDEALEIAESVLDNNKENVNK